MDSELSSKMMTRLNKIEGQVRGVRGMVERREYCDDILTQIASVQASMGAVAKMLLDSHIKTCISPRLAEGDNTAVEELIKTIGRLM